MSRAILAFVLFGCASNVAAEPTRPRPFRQAWIDNNGMVQGLPGQQWASFVDGRLVGLLPRARPLARTKGSRVGSYAAWCGLKAADIASTEWALSRGGVESNPLMKDRGVRIAAGVGVCVAAGEVDHRLKRHTKTRWAYRIVGLGLMGYAAQRNARVAQRGR